MCRICVEMPIDSDDSSTFPLERKSLLSPRSDFDALRGACERPVFSTHHRYIVLGLLLMFFMNRNPQKSTWETKNDTVRMECVCTTTSFINTINLGLFSFVFFFFLQSLILFENMWNIVNVNRVKSRILPEKIWFCFLFFLNSLTKIYNQCFK